MSEQETPQAEAPIDVDALKTQLRESETRTRELRQAIKETEKDRKKNLFLRIKDKVFSKKGFAVLLGVLTGGIGTLMINPLYAPLRIAITTGVLAFGSSILRTLGLQGASAGVPLSSEATGSLVDAAIAPLAPFGTLIQGEVKTSFK